MNQHSGSRKIRMPPMSIHARVRLLRRQASTSMRTWPLFRKVAAAPSMKAAANRYHWISSQALEPRLNSLRTTALPALITVAAKMNQIMILPTNRLNASMDAEILSRNPIGDSMSGPRGGGGLDAAENKKTARVLRPGRSVDAYSFWAAMYWL